MRYRTVLSAALVAALAGACSSESPPSRDAPPARDAPAREAPGSDALDQMVIAFQGSPSREEIKSAMDEALTSVGETPTNDLYSRGGSVLVTFRQNYGVDEMEILRCIPDLGRTGVGLSFPDAAALCVTDLSTR